MKDLTGNKKRIIYMEPNYYKLGLNICFGGAVGFYLSLVLFSLMFLFLNFSEEEGEGGEEAEEDE